MEQFRNLFGPLKPVGRGGNLSAQGQEIDPGRDALRRVSDGKQLSQPSKDRVDVGKLPYLIAINQKIAERFQSLSRTFGFSAPEAKSSPEKAKSAADISREGGTSSKKAEVKTGKEAPSPRPEIKMSKAEAPPAKKSASVSGEEPSSQAGPSPQKPPVRLPGAAATKSATASAWSPGAELPATYKMAASGQAAPKPADADTKGLPEQKQTASQIKASLSQAQKPDPGSGSAGKLSFSPAPAEPPPVKLNFPMNFQPEVSQVLLASLNQLKVEKESFPPRDGKGNINPPKVESRANSLQSLLRNPVQPALRANVFNTRPTSPTPPRVGTSLNRPVTGAASTPPPVVRVQSPKTDNAETPAPKIQVRPPVPEPPKPLKYEAPKPQETAKLEPPPKQEPQSLSAREALEAQILLQPQVGKINQQARVLSSASVEEKTDRPVKKEAPGKAEEASLSSPLLNRRDISRSLSPAAGSEVQSFQAEIAQPSSSVVEDARQAKEQALVSAAVQLHEEAGAKPDLHLPMISQLAAEYVPRDSKKSKERESELNWVAVGGESDETSSAKAEAAQSPSGGLNIEDAATDDVEGFTQASFQAQKAPVTEAGKIGAVLLAAHESPQTPLFSSVPEAPPPPIVQTSFVKKSRASSESSYETEVRSGETAARAHVLQAGQKEPLRTGSQDFRYVSFSVGEMDTLGEKITPKSNARTLDFSQSRSLIVEVSRASEAPADEKGGQRGSDQGSGRDRPYTFQSEYILNQLRKQQLGESQHQNILETAKEATIEKYMEDAMQLEYFSRLAPLKHGQQASRLATTCIEVILRKSYKDDVTGERSAAKMLALMLKANNDDTFEHSTRVIDLSVSLAAEIGVTDEKDLRLIEEGALLHDIGETQIPASRYSPEEQDRLALFLEDVDLAQCSAFHDIGKLKIPKEVLNKSTSLTKEEYGLMKQHPIIGEEMLRPISSLRPILPTVRGHHERWDGEGYPDGLSGENIPLAARIISITDTWDAMISDRPYRKGIPLNLAARELRKGAGSQFDPELVDRFLAMVEKQFAS